MVSVRLKSNQVRATRILLDQRIELLRVNEVTDDGEVLPISEAAYKEIGVLEDIIIALEDAGN